MDRHPLSWIGHRPREGCGAMRHRLTARERSALNSIAEHLRRDDPELAALLEGPTLSVVQRCSPLRWSPGVYLISGVALVGSGLVLGVGSAVVGGFVALAAAVLRSQSARGAVNSALRKSGGWLTTPG